MMRKCWLYEYGGHISAMCGRCQSADDLSDDICVFCTLYVQCLVGVTDDETNHTHNGFNSICGLWAVSYDAFEQGVPS